MKTFRSAVWVLGAWLLLGSCTSLHQGAPEAPRRQSLIASAETEFWTITLYDRISHLEVVVLYRPGLEQRKAFFVPFQRSVDARGRVLTEDPGIPMVETEPGVYKVSLVTRDPRAKFYYRFRIDWAWEVDPNAYQNADYDAEGRIFGGIFLWLDEWEPG